MTRDAFMAFLRDDTMLNQLSADDPRGNFLASPDGQLGYAKELLDRLIRDYSVGGLDVLVKASELSVNGC